MKGTNMVEAPADRNQKKTFGNWVSYFFGNDKSFEKGVSDRRIKKKQRNQFGESAFLILSFSWIFNQGTLFFKLMMTIKSCKKVVSRLVIKTLNFVEEPGFHT